MKKILKKYLVESLFLLIAIIFTIISLIIFFQNKTENQEEIFSIKEEKNILKEKIYVDISGSVKKPGLYQLNNGSRLKEALDKAEGLSENADKNFFYRNFNLARILADQEKIYIPSVWEVQAGLFSETPQQINFIYPNIQQTISNQDLININEASIDELDALPGIGKITAQKIINNRPYQNLEDLINKKIVNKTTYEKIKNLITL